MHHAQRKTKNSVPLLFFEKAGDKNGMTLHNWKLFFYKTNSTLCGIQTSNLVILWQLTY